MTASTQPASTQPEQLEAACRSQVLELLVTGAPLQQILEVLLHGLELQRPGAVCSLLLLDSSGQFFEQVVAPSLPDFYRTALTGLAIGPGAGPCGAAALSGQRVVVDDLGSDPDWSANRALAARVGVSACWSQPVLSAGGRVLGTFAIYHREKRAPDAADLLLIQQCAALACIAIEKDSEARKLRDSEARYRTLVEWSPDPVLVHRMGTILYANPAAVRTFGASDASELLGRNTSTLVHPDFQEQQRQRMQAIVAKEAIPPLAESRFVHMDGTAFDVEVQGTAILFEGQSAIHVVLRDITRVKNYQRRLEELAHFDTLTHLPNRLLLADRLQQAMSQAQRRQQTLAVVFLDLDGFKAVNDQYGHDVGDALLIAVSQRMKGALRDGDTLARIGGDEFVAVLVDLQQPDDAQPVLERLLQAAADPVSVGEARIQVSASMGIAVYPRDGSHTDLLLRRADQSMYLAKQAGRNRFQFFNQPDNKAADA